VLLLVECKFFDDCTFRYDALEMRGDGSSFILKLRLTAGFTYTFTTTLTSGSAAHLRFVHICKLFSSTAYSASSGVTEVAGRLVFLQLIDSSYF
jgi:hypothetical protein